MKIVGAISIACLFLMMSNCTTLRREIPSTGTQNVNNKFVIGPATTGQGCASRILLFDIIEGARKGKILGDDTFPFISTRKSAMIAASQDAISKLPNADFLLSPVVTLESQNYIVYENTCAKVKARGVTIQ